MNFIRRVARPIARFCVRTWKIAFPKKIPTREELDQQEEARLRACGNYTERQFQEDMQAYIRKSERGEFFFQQ